MSGSTNPRPWRREFDGVRRWRTARRRRAFVGALVAFGLGPGCSNEPLPPSGTALLQDSAGVRIIDSGAREAATPPMPLRTGEVLGELGPHFLGGQQELTGLLGGAFEASGALVLVSSHRPLLRRWAPAEGRLQALELDPEEPFGDGRTTLLHPLRDGVLLWDRSRERGGTLGWRRGLGWESSFRLPDGGQVVGRLSRGAWVSVATLPPESGEHGAERVRVYLRTGGAAEWTVLGEWPGRHRTPVQGRIRDLPFAAPPPVAVVEQRVFVVAPDGDVHVFSSEGRRERLLRTGTTGRPVSAQDRAAYLRVGIAALGPEARPLLEELLAQVDQDEQIPAFDRILVTPGGRLWLRHTLTDPEHPQDWTIVDTPGQVSHRARTPPGLELLAVHERRVAGMARHPMGFRVIRMYELELAHLDGG